MSLSSQPVIALVPARGGSKGIPRKNMSEILGRPLVEYTLRAALDSNGIEDVWLSSDDAEILSLCSSLNIKIINRPREYATDDASAVDVVKHFISVLPSKLRNQDPLIVYLQPTSPLRTSKHLEKALKLLEKHNASSLVSVVELSKSPYKSFRLDENGRLESLFDERLSNMRRQDLPPIYIPNGAIYIFRASDFNNRNGFPSNGSIPFIMSERDSIDVDSLEDLIRVKELLSEKNA
jgi:CMP-N,N'-diacetyllegionaminic acid synthase